MNRIKQMLTGLQHVNRKILSPYITAGDPDIATTLAIMHALVAGGADILEIGLPFSDPMAEGVVIQEAMERALKQHVDIDVVLHLIALFRQKNQQTPIVLMGYLNPIEIYGYACFAEHAVTAGVDGTILVDLPPEESAEIMAIWKQHDLYHIYLCSPTTTTARMQLIQQYAQGYLYYVSVKGVTGSDDFNIKEVQKKYEQRKQETTLPVMVGFGIKTPEMAAAIAEFADGVIVGAALISELAAVSQQKGDVAEKSYYFINAMRLAMNKGA